MAPAGKISAYRESFLEEYKVDMEGKGDVASS